KLVIIDPFRSHNGVAGSAIFEVVLGSEDSLHPIAKETEIKLHASIGKLVVWGEDVAREFQEEFAIAIEDLAQALYFNEYPKLTRIIQIFEYLAKEIGNRDDLDFQQKEATTSAIMSSYFESIFEAADAFMGIRKLRLQVLRHLRKLNSTFISSGRPENYKAVSSLYRSLLFTRVSGVSEFGDLTNKARDGEILHFALFTFEHVYRNKSVLTNEVVERSLFFSEQRRLYERALDWRDHEDKNSEAFKGIIQLNKRYLPRLIRHTTYRGSIWTNFDRFPVGRGSFSVAG
nr:hypothetical protein [Gammaproteobacteria bacterium]